MDRTCRCGHISKLLLSNVDGKIDPDKLFASHLKVPGANPVGKARSYLLPPPLAEDDDPVIALSEYLLHLLFRAQIASRPLDVQGNYRKLINVNIHRLIWRQLCLGL